MSDSGSKTIAYLTSAYARVGDTFIRREVENLRELGFTVHTFSIRKTEGEDVSEEIKREQATTNFILEHGWAKLLWESTLQMLSQPLTFTAAAWLAFCTRNRGLRGLLLQIAYLMEAAYLVRQMRSLKVRHLHNHIPGNSASVAMLSSRMSGIPYSMTVHGPTVFTAAENWALRTKIARSAFTVTISDYTRSQCMLYTDPKEWDKLKIVRCGVDSMFLDASPTPVPEEPRLVFVGRLCEDKGILILIDALKSLLDDGVSFKVDLVGDGPSRAEIESALAEYSLSDSVTLLGWLGSDSVRERILASRALVLPSFAEGLPVVMMEALALNRPVVGTYIAGIPELVERGSNGWLVPAGSSAKLSAALKEVLTTTTVKLESMGKAGTRVVAERHNVRHETERLAGYLLESIGKGKKGFTTSRSDGS